MGLRITARILPWTSVLVLLAPTLLAFLQRTAILSLSTHTGKDELAHQSW